MLDTIEGAKDQFAADELKTLKAGAQQVKEIEDKLMALEKEFPGCGSTPGEGESVDASTTGMTNGESGETKFPSFKGKDLDGNDVNSDELFSKNKVTVMNFWFTTCKPCVGELGDLEKLNKELAEKGGQVVGVNSFTLDGKKDEVADAKDVLSKKGVTYKNIWFKSDSEAGKFTSNLYSFPTTYVIDQNGNIVGEPIMGGINTGLNNALTGMGNSSKVILGLVLGGMMAIDMGGPFNKAAYVFGTAAIAAGNYDIMAAVMVGGMTPPCAIALASLLFKDKFTKEEREAGPTNFIMGLAFITEGAIPFCGI